MVQLLVAKEEVYIQNVYNKLCSITTLVTNSYLCLRLIYSVLYSTLYSTKLHDESQLQYCKTVVMIGQVHNCNEHAYC